jgi:hypothetical protein
MPDIIKMCSEISEVKYEDQQTNEHDVIYMSLLRETRAINGILCYYTIANRYGI